MNLSQKIDLKIEIAELESYLPSFKAIIDCKFEHPGGLFSYTASDIWFDCNEWDTFSKEVNSFSVEERVQIIKLKSLSENFILTVSQKHNIFELKILIKESTSNGVMNFDINITVDYEELFKVKKWFAEFEKLW